MVASVPPLLHTNEYGAIPFAGVAVMLPLYKPQVALFGRKEITGICVVVSDAV
jgi:hypothetical protein